MRRIQRPYSDLYLKDVQLNIGYMCELACQLGIPLNEILSRFSISSIALQIERANPHYMIGLSAIEYIRYLYPDKDYNYKDCDFVYGMNFWCGWAFAYLEWYTGFDFRSLYRIVPADRLLIMYGAYHSMDIGHLDRFADEYVLNDDIIREKVWGN